MEELVWRKEGEERCVRSMARGLHEKDSNIQQTPSYPPPQTPPHSPAMGVVGGHPLLNKRESASAKMNERYLVGQPIQNPFMPNSNYLNDLEVQMNFLTPQKLTDHYTKN